MRLILKKPSAEHLIEGLAGVEGAQAFRRELVEKIEFRKGTEAEVDFDLLEADGIAAVERIASQHGDRSVSTQIATFKRILSQPRSAKISRLGHLEGAVVEWMLDGVIKGWVFKRDASGLLLAWAVEDVRLTSGYNHEPHIFVQMAANIPHMIIHTDRSVRHEGISIHQKDLPATVDEIMAEEGYLHETIALHAEYEETRERFAQIHEQVNAQFRLAGGVYKREGRNISYDERAYITGGQHRCINDETLVRRTIRDASGRDGWDDRLSGGRRRNAAPGGQRAIPDDAFCEMPTHFLHLVFDLDAHVHAWVPPSAMTEYVYTPEKVNLLVLPDSHRELVDILTSDADVLIEDVVEGKTGGTTILLEGEPGLGKTLLAEVYAEKMRQALYRVPAGQLGITPESVAKGIALVYENAARWRAVVLIDEADVYIRKRGESMSHNAVVAALLVTLERQTAMTFLATNRSNDVDEAIISRCIAIVHFDMPTVDASREIWRIQSNVMGLDLPASVIDEIVAHHGKDGIQRASGRDIRALLKLAYRYHKLRGKPLDAELLRQLGAFKRL